MSPAPVFLPSSLKSYFPAGPHGEGDDVAIVRGRAEDRDQAQRLPGNVASC